MKYRTRAVIALGLGATLAVGPSLAAFGAGGTLTNGSFESDAAGSTSVTGWTSMNQLIDLGTTSIAGCTTSDTSNYANLRDYASEAEGTWDNTYASVPGLNDIYYVHDLNGDPVTILGDRLVWDDWDGYYYIEVEDFVITSTEISPSSVAEEPVTEPAPAEPTPSEPTPDPSAPAEPAPGESAPAEPAPSEPAPAEPAPSEPQFTPAEATYSYVIEWDWSSEQWAAFEVASAAAAPDPSVRADDPANAGLTEEEYSVTVIDGVDVDREGNVLELYSDLDGDIDGYVTHGPAVYSDPFTVGAGRQISLDWKAVDESDDFHVFGYLLNTETCAQTEVIDATGESQDWTTTQVEIPAAGTYRFVFVSGSYDYSWGGAAGAYMYIDNIVQTPVFGSPGVDLALAAGVGDFLPGSDVQVSGGGLEPESEYGLVLRSTPVTVVEGVTDADGNFVNVVALPDDIEPGAHTITLTAQGPSGPVSIVAYITVGTDGKLQYFSLSGPQALLAFTGAAENAGIIALALLLTVTGAAAIEFERRRRSPFSAVYVR